MTIEERVGHALTEEAVARKVDLRALYADTLARAEEETSATPPVLRNVRRRGWPGVAPVAVAATVLAFVGVSLTQRLGGLDLSGPTTDTSDTSDEGGVRRGVHVSGAGHLRLEPARDGHQRLLRGQPVRRAAAAGRHLAGAALQLRGGR